MRAGGGVKPQWFANSLIHPTGSHSGSAELGQDGEAAGCGLPWQGVVLVRGLRATLSHQQPQQVSSGPFSESLEGPSERIPPHPGLTVNNLVFLQDCT